jgi:hypothetical protein
MDDLSFRIEVHDKEPKTQDHVGGHINAPADKLGEAMK